METTFMTIHNLTPDANILFASESIVDILGYQPYEVIGRSSFDYFHYADLPFARYWHHRNVQLDKAAVLYYARIRAKNNSWISCECVFTVVYDVLVACTSIYKGNIRNNQRDLEAKRIRRIFSSPPRDPRYHMLEHLAPKFTSAPPPNTGEPRAALILNRFSRTLSIMYSTNAISNILGVTADEIRGKSFYECIDETCLPDAIRCLEGAKANDSIAYLRFVFRDPRRREELEQLDREASQSSDSEDGGVQLDLHGGDDVDVPMEGVEQGQSAPDRQNINAWSTQGISRTESGGSTDLEQDSASATFDRQPKAHSHSSASSAPSLSAPEDRNNERRARRSVSRVVAPMEVEAVISCTSDGLVVIIRAAPIMQQPYASEYTNGLFAAPWAASPIMPINRRAPTVNPGGPSMDDFMSSIRDVAVFAWSLTGINGNIASYSHGTPRGEAVPPTGFPIWDPNGKNAYDLGPENQAARKWASLEQSQSPTAAEIIARQHPNQVETHTNKSSDGSSPIESSVTGSHVLDQNGNNGHSPQYSHPHPQLGTHGASQMEENWLTRSDVNSSGNQPQGSGGGSNPVRYMWY